jgi:hypothetical protein
MTRPNLLTRLLLRCSRPFREGHLLHADGTPYMERFALFETPWISARIHHIASPDLDRDMHDHPWNFASLVLSGGYTEARPTFPRHPQWIDGLEDRSYARREAGTVAFRRATDRHLISDVDPGTWTLFVYGAAFQWWGFYTRLGKVHWTEYSSIHASAESHGLELMLKSESEGIPSWP